MVHIKTNKAGVFLYFLPPYLFEADFLLNLELTDDTGLSGQQTLGRLQLPPLQHWNYGHELLLAFFMGAGDPKCCLCNKHLTTTKASFQPLFNLWETEPHIAQTDS